MDAELLRGLVAKMQSADESVRVESLAAWLDAQQFRPDILSIAAATIRALYSGRLLPELSVAQGQGWRPIESAPRDGLLLTFHPRFGQRILRPDPHNAGWYLDETGGPTREATHWQPLPAAPAQPDGVE